MIKQSPFLRLLVSTLLSIRQANGKMSLMGNPAYDDPVRLSSRPFRNNSLCVVYVQDNATSALLEDSCDEIGAPYQDFDGSDGDSLATTYWGGMSFMDVLILGSSGVFVAGMHILLPRV
jgi:hypothetical protein